MCSDCEAYGLKKYGLTRSDCLYFMGWVREVAKDEELWSRIPLYRRKDEENATTEPWP